MTRARSVANRGWQATRKNLLINGAMMFWQRDTSGTVPLGQFTYTTDRWVCDPSGAAISWGRGRHPVNTDHDASLILFGAAGNTSARIAQRIEGANAYHVAGKKLTVSGWMYSATARAVTVSLTTPAAANDWTSAQTAQGQATFNHPGTGWVQFALTFPTAMPTAVGRGLQLFFSFPTVTGQVGLTDVQLEVGEEATEFERLPFSDIVSQCQRFYFRGQIPCGGAFSTGAPLPLKLPVTMRVTPAFNGAFSVGAGSGGTPGYLFSSAEGCVVYNTANNWSVGVGVAWSGTIDAEL